MIFSESFGKKYSSNLSFRKKCPGKSVLVLTFYILLPTLLKVESEGLKPVHNCQHLISPASPAVIQKYPRRYPLQICLYYPW